MTTIREFLDSYVSTVEKPLRYLGREFGAEYKAMFTSPDEGLNTVLCFPDTYEIGMSHLGVRILYSLLNNHSSIMCDRAYFPYPDMLVLMDKHSIPMFSLEQQQPLSAFDAVGFSVQYEMSYPTILQMLKKGGITVLSDQRGEDEPFILAGGPVISNPEIIAPFVDIVFIGEAEHGYIQLLETIRNGRIKKQSREQILRSVTEIPGVYVPRFYRPEYDGNGRLTAITVDGAPARVQRRIEDLSQCPLPDRLIVPTVDIVHNRVSLEIMRGCARGCRFCHAGYYYRPLRERSCDGLIGTAEKILKQSGYNELSLLSLSSIDYSCISGLMQGIKAYADNERISLSLPSSRIDKLSDEVLAGIQDIKKTGLTIAPEAGTQRLRDVINKNISDEEIYAVIDTAYRRGWNTIKLYFMIGLPTETQADYDGIVEMLNRIARPGKKVNVTLSLFTPKPHTPFEREKQMSGAEYKAACQYIKSKVKRSVRISWRDEFITFLEGLFSRGDRRLAPLLTDAVDSEIFLDGWDEYIRKDTWRVLLEKHGITDAWLAERGNDEVLPWSMIDPLLTGAFLRSEREKAYRGELTPDCSTACSGCGSCGGSLTISEPEKKNDIQKDPVVTAKKINYRIYFSRDGVMKYLSQKDAINCIEFSLRRAGLPLAYTEGFSPHPKLSFCNPAPVGVRTVNDHFDIECTDTITATPAELSAFFPEGMTINAVGECKNEALFIETISFKSTEQSLRSLTAEAMSFVDNNGKTQYINGIETVTFNGGRISMRFDNRKTSIKKIMLYLGGDHPRYDLHDTARESIT